MKKRTWLFAALALTAAFATPHAQPQDQDLQIQRGGIQLQLGMPQEDVLRKLALVCDVKHIDNLPGNWSVTRKGGPPYRLVGNVSFRNERLVFVNKSWGPEFDNQTASALATALHNAVQAVAGRGRACTASVESVGSGSQTIIECGRHRLQVFAPRDSNYAASVSEILSSDR